MSGRSAEAELLRLVAQKDQKAFERLYDLYSRLIYSLILSIVKTEAEAEDVLQEIFLKVWEKATSFSEARGNVYGWLVTLARNRAIDRIRSKGFQAQSESAPLEAETTIVAGQTNPLDIVVMSERAELVKSALLQIPPEQRDVIETAYFGGYSQSEIATKLSIPLGTVKTRMRQGMKKLQLILRERL